MKKIGLLFAAFATVIATATSATALTFAAYERNEKIVDASGSEIPFNVGGARNTSLYIIPTAWEGILDDVANTYIAAYMWKSSDDTNYCWQLIKACSIVGTLINRSSITISATSYNAYQFKFDLTHYDRLSVLRICTTDALTAYIGNNPNTYTCTNSSNNPLPSSWNNVDTSNTYKRYNSTHTLSKPSKSNVYTITSTTSGGNYGFLSSGSWTDDTIVNPV